MPEEPRGALDPSVEMRTSSRFSADPRGPRSAAPTPTILWRGLCQGVAAWDRPHGEAGVRSRSDLSDLTYGVLDGVADVDRAGLVAFHQADHAFDQVVDVLYAPGLGTFSVDGQGLAEEGLSYEVRQ